MVFFTLKVTVKGVLGKVTEILGDLGVNTAAFQQEDRGFECPRGFCFKILEDRDLGSRSVNRKERHYSAAKNILDRLV